MEAVQTMWIIYCLKHNFVFWWISLIFNYVFLTFMHFCKLICNSAPTSTDLHPFFSCLTHNSFWWKYTRLHRWPLTNSPEQNRSGEQRGFSSQAMEHFFNWDHLLADWSGCVTAPVNTFILAPTERMRVSAMQIVAGRCWAQTTSSHPHPPPPTMHNHQHVTDLQGLQVPLPGSLILMQLGRCKLFGASTPCHRPITCTLSQL